MSMSDNNNRIEPTLDPLPVRGGIPADASPEEREAAQAANDAGLLSQLQAELEALKSKNT